ncbi:MAG TPA: RluA family pseudouridine synthase [Thermoguttaceae bacterium]|nr:RluA family pseudouridine synthase [Thermoguttaceae bacterium]
MTTPPLEILYEDNHLLAVSKPAGLPTMGTPQGKPTLLTIAKEYVKQKYGKPGNVYLGMMSRLDAPVTGVVLLARTSKAARRLTQQFRTHAVEKAYWAIVEGTVEPPAGQCVDWVAPHERHRRMRIVGPKLPGAKEARLSYRRISTLGADSLLEIDLHTGRKHQIRLQLAHRGHPILGDRKYGSRRSWPSGIALHAQRLSITHPVQGTPLIFEAPLPDSWRNAGMPGSPLAASPDSG